MNMSRLITIIKGLALSIVGLLIFSVANAESNEWLADEMLRQLQEIRNEMKGLRGEVVQLREEIKHLEPKGTQGGKAKARVSTTIGDDPSFGKKEAQIAIIEYSDFQCPFCTRHNKQTLPQIKKAYIDTGKVQYVMKDFPLASHKEAKRAAVAANCAGEQDQYEAMRNLLFNNSRKINLEFYKAKAKSLKLNVPGFVACLDNVKQIKEVEADLAEGSALGVRGTPAFFIGKVKDGKIKKAIPISGAQPFAKFQQVIESL